MEDSGTLVGLIRRGAGEAFELLRTARAVLFPPACRFTPSCSAYARQAVSEHGVLKGAALAAARLARCQPFHAGGHDPVPRGN